MLEEQQVEYSDESVFIDGMTRSRGQCLYMISCSCTGVMIWIYVWRKAKEIGLLLLKVARRIFEIRWLSYIVPLNSSVYIVPGSLNAFKKR